MGDAQRRKLAGLPKFEKPQPHNQPLRSPQEVEDAMARENALYGMVSAAIDFVHLAEESALKARTHQLLMERTSVNINRIPQPQNA